LLKRALVDEGHEVVCAYDGAVALGEMRRQRFDLVVLDVNMPKLGGFQVLARMRHDSMAPTAPVLFLTGRGRMDDMLLGFDSGCDDYMTKPFDMDELLARVKALLRRGQSRPEETPVVVVDSPGLLTAGALTLDLTTHQAHIGEKTVQLTPIESQILRYFLEHPHQVHSTQSLLREIWHDGDATMDTSLVRWHVKKLRAKIEPDPHTPQFIRTVFRHGYIL
jgi:DNA-binding response OmpR family regulator